MKNSIILLFYVVLITLLSACSLKPTSLETNTYTIDFKLEKNDFNRIKKELYIEKPIVHKIFDTHAILYTKKAYQFEEYAVNKWIDTPSDMIYNSLVESLESNEIFNNIYKDKSKNDSLYKLKTEVTSMYNSIEKNKSYAVLKLKFYFEMNGKNINTFIYDQKILLKNNNPYAFVFATNKNFENAINKWIDEIDKRL